MTPRMNTATGLVSASRCYPRQMPRVHTESQKAGLAYERKVVSSLADSLILSGQSFDLCHNPWFEYAGTYGSALCVPDGMISLQEGEYRDNIFVLEVKLTYTPEAIEKLLDVYCPVVAKAFGLPATPVVICKNLIPGAPLALPSFFGAVEAWQMGRTEFPLVQWLGTSRLRLGLPETLENAPKALRSLR